MEAGWTRTLEEHAKLARRGGARPAPDELHATGPKGSIQRNHAFQCVLDVFKEYDVGTVVRLNEEMSFGLS